MKALFLRAAASHYQIDRAWASFLVRLESENLRLPLFPSPDKGTKIIDGSLLRCYRIDDRLTHGHFSESLALLPKQVT